MILRRPAMLPTVLLALPLALLPAGCNSLKAISITPATGVETLYAVGQTAQYTAIGTSEMGSAQPTTSNITGTVTWSVSNPNVASISAAGLATAIGSGYTEIMAESGGVTATSDLTVSISATAAPTLTLTLTPNTVTETFAGETTQFLATGAGITQNTQATWLSSNAQVATVNAIGTATAVGAGTTTITAQYNGMLASAALTVAVSTITPATPTLSIIPSAGAGATATFPGETTQFIAIGNVTGTGAIQNLSSDVLWSSSDVSVATIDQSGLATAVSTNTGPTANTTVITAIASTAGGSLITATSVLAVDPAGGSVSLPTLAVYETGAGAGTVTSSSSGVTGGIKCGPGATACTAPFTLGSVVTLTATPATESSFGGWSASCIATNAPTLPEANTCTVKMGSNETVGAIFNTP